MKIQAYTWILLFFIVGSNTVQGLLPPSPSNKIAVHHHQQLSSHHRLAANEPIKTHRTVETSDASPNQIPQSRNRASSWFAAAYFFVACTFAWCEPMAVLAETTTTTTTTTTDAAASTSSWTQKVASSLKAPTEDSPRIELPIISGASQQGSSTPPPLFPKPGSSSNNNNKQPSKNPPPWRVQGLVSLENPRIERPYGTDFMIVQVLKEAPPKEPYAVTDDTKKNVLGGAKIQVGKFRFPSSITLGLENAKVQDNWKEVASTKDLWLEVTICKEDSAKFPCAPEEQRYRAVAFSKLFNSPQISESSEDAAAIRLPATMILERINNADDD